MLANILQIIGVLLQYWICLAQFVFAKKAYSECVLFPQDKHARVQIFSLALIFRLWSEPHYRSKSFQQDMLDNLKNVAVPGTGVALSWFCYSKVTAMFFVFLLNPLICFLGAINQARHSRTTDSIHELIHLIDVHFTRNLLHPDDWFSLWRMNCRLVSYHSLVTGSTDYKMEDKWTFLVAGKALHVPVSPYDDTTEALVCKNKLIEGGMGIHFYRNAAFGGDWILQERLQNAAWLNALLPANAPLSTMRVITTSSFTLSEEYPLRQNRDLLNKSTLSSQNDDDEDDDNDIGNANGHSNDGGAAVGEPSTSQDRDADVTRYIRAESAVLRLGRMHANTDHSSILFDVDVATGIIQGGTSNAHWYQLGPLTAIPNTPWLPPKHRMRHHIDPPYPTVTGQRIPSMDEALQIVTRAHYAMMPEVPIVGWDVAFTTKGIFLLEVNLSCNFFRGSFDLPRYIDLIDRYWLQLEKMARLNADFKENHQCKASSTTLTGEAGGVSIAAGGHGGDASGSGTVGGDAMDTTVLPPSSSSLSSSSLMQPNAASSTNSGSKMSSPHRRGSKSNSRSHSVHTSWDNLSLDNTANGSIVGSSSNNGTLMTMALMQDLLTTETVLEGAFERSRSHDEHDESPNDIDHGHGVDDDLTPVLPQNPAQTIKYKRHSFRHDATPAAST